VHKECAIVIPNLELVAPVAFGRDNPNTTVQFLDTGHFALETHVEEIALSMRDFLQRLPHHTA